METRALLLTTGQVWTQEQADETLWGYPRIAGLSVWKLISFNRQLGGFSAQRDQLIGKLRKTDSVSESRSEVGSRAPIQYKDDILPV